MHLVLDQQRAALLKAHGRARRIGKLVLQARSHAQQFEAAQLLDRRVHHHVFLILV